LSLSSHLLLFLNDADTINGFSHFIKIIINHHEPAIRPLTKRKGRGFQPHFLQTNNFSTCAFDKNAKNNILRLFGGIVSPLPSLL